MSAPTSTVFCTHCQQFGHARFTCSAHLAVVGSNASNAAKRAACASCLGDNRRGTPRANTSASARAAPPVPSSNGAEAELARLRAQVASLTVARSQDRAGHYRTFVHHARLPAATAAGGDGAVEVFALNATSLVAAVPILAEYQSATIHHVRVELIAVGQEASTGLVVGTLGAARGATPDVTAIFRSPVFFSTHASRGTAVHEVDDLSSYGVSRQLDVARRPSGAPDLRVCAAVVGVPANLRPHLRVVVTLLLRGSNQLG